MEKVKAEVLEETTKPESTEETAPRFRDCFRNSRPVKFVRRHKVGTGIGAAVALIGAAVAAVKASGTDGNEVIDVVAEVISDASETVSE